MALSGDFKGAHAIIDGTPLDCNLCVRTRGRIAALEKNWAGAARWFERAAQDAPSIPFADSEWGTMLLGEGDADAAIEKFTLANQKGPHFADPLEGWGEALMAKNQSHLALAKFAEAEKYAPNWGRLHLKWGEALCYAGKKDEAAKQFARAARSTSRRPKNPNWRGWLKTRGRAMNREASHERDCDWRAPPPPLVWTGICRRLHVAGVFRLFLHLPDGGCGAPSSAGFVCAYRHGSSMACSFDNAGSACPIAQTRFCIASSAITASSLASLRRFPPLRLRWSCATTT